MTEGAAKNLCKLWYLRKHTASRVAHCLAVAQPHSDGYLLTSSSQVCHKEYKGPPDTTQSCAETQTESGWFPKFELMVEPYLPDQICLHMTESSSLRDEQQKPVDKRVTIPHITLQRHKQTQTRHFAPQRLFLTRRIRIKSKKFAGWGWVY